MSKPAVELATHWTEMIAHLKTNGVPLDEPISVGRFIPIAEKYGIESDAREVARLLLNLAAYDFANETLVLNINRSAVRKEAKKIQKTAEKLLNQLSSLSADTDHVIQLASAAQLAMPLAKVEGQKITLATDDPEDLLALPMVEMLAEPRLETLHLQSVSDQLNGLIAQTEIWLNVAGAGKTGAPENHTLDMLFTITRLMFEPFTGKPYRLLFEEGTDEPLTYAAAFCVDVCEAIDPTIARSLIVTKSQSVRKDANDDGHLALFERLLSAIE